MGSHFNFFNQFNYIVYYIGRKAMGSHFNFFNQFNYIVYYLG